MNNFNLKSINRNLKTSADWYSLREVFESNNIQIARDGHPENNHVSTTHGVNRIGKFNFDTHTHALPRNRINSFLTWKYKEYETGFNTRYINP